MNTEANKSFVRNHFEEFVNRKNLDVADKNFARDYQEHGSDAPPNSPPGPEGPKRYLAAAFKRFPDIHVTIEDIIAEDDKVVVRNTWRATAANRTRKSSSAASLFGESRTAYWPSAGLILKHRIRSIEFSGIKGGA